MGFANLDIRKEIRLSGCKMYEIAAALSISPAALSMRMSKELTPAGKNEIRRGIKAARKQLLEEMIGA